MKTEIGDSQWIGSYFPLPEVTFQRQINIFWVSQRTARHETRKYMEMYVFIFLRDSRPQRQAHAKCGNDYKSVAP